MPTAEQPYNDATRQAVLCGIIILSNAAILILHILRFLAVLLALVEEVPELQKVVHSKR
jgi:hypothetical protein